MSYRYIDTHAHLHFPEFDHDREAVLARMKEEEVAMIAVGTSLETSKGAAAFAAAHPDLVLGAIIGVHPTDTNEGFVAADYELLLNEKIVAVGECGLDYYQPVSPEDKERQTEIFKAQIGFAVAHDLPLMLHVRPSKGSDDAHEDALALLEPLQAAHGRLLRGNAHFFTGSLAMAERYWSIGFKTSFPGVVTFAREVASVVKAAPLNMILAETDSPYAAPIPYRGQRCEPWMVKEVYKKIAATRGEDEEKLREQLMRNAKGLFKI